MSNEHNNPPVACGNGCDCLAQCGDTYAHAGLPKPSETEKAAPAPAVPQGEPVGVVYSFPSGDGNTAWGFKPNDSAWEVEKQPKSYERRFNVYLQATAPPQPAVPQGWKLVEMDDIKTGLNAALANVQAPAPTVPRGEAWGYVDHRGCAIKFKNARHRSELANAIECGGLEYLYTSPAEKLSNDIQSALESLVERCNHDAGMSNEDAVIHAEAVLEHVYNSRSTTPAPSPAQEVATLPLAAEDVHAAFAKNFPKSRISQAWINFAADIAQAIAARAAKPAQEVTLTDCNCRWDGSEQVQWCELHLAHKDAIHEWAERAKTAEAKLDRLSSNQEVGLTEAERVRCLIASGCIGTVKMTYDSGPYEITRTSINASRLIDAIIAALRAKGGK